MGSRVVAWLIALLVVVALAATGVYLYRQQHGGPPPQVATGEGAKPAPPAPPAAPKPDEAPQAKPTSVPSFDVVRVEPTGEGVIAGRAEPGWTVKIESAGTVYGETTADDEGAWSIVLDKPLPSGDHALALRAYSADGARALTAQQQIKVAVGEGGKAAGEQEQAAASDLASQPQPVVPDENAPREHGTPPVKIDTVEYKDKGEDSGTISLSGKGQPNVQVFLFFDDQPLGQFNVGEDGTWTYEVEKKLDSEEHTVRADTYDEKTSVVQGRASVRLGREPGAAVTAAPEAAPPAPAPAVAQAGPSGQPEPVYPDGAPEVAAASPEAAASAPASYDLSSQPQPVYPEEMTVAEAAPASSQDLSSQPQPVYPGEAEAEAAAPAPEASAEVAAAPSGSRPQPEPVYPDGAPEMAAAAPEAPQAPAPEAYDLSSQPQPAVPEETAAEESARKMAASPPAEPSPPEATPAEPGAPVVTAETPAEPPQPEATPAAPAAPSVTAEQPSEQAPAAPEQPAVVFKSVDYQDTEEGKGTVSIAGAGEPGARIFLFFDEEPLGEVSVAEDGTWAFETEKKVETGEHNFRADRLDETGVVVGRASIGIIRLEEPKAEVAAAPEAAPAPSASPAGEEPGQEVAATEGEPATEGATHATPGVHTVQRGDTLWDIAEEYYGGGWRYRAIVRENRRKIRNPHWIYPDQEFQLPASRWDQ